MKLKRLFLCAVALLLALNSIAYAVVDTQFVIDGILSCARGDASLQDWLDGPLRSGVGSNSDNYLFVLPRLHPELDYSAYAQDLSAALSGDGIRSVTSRQRSALALIACGGMDLLPEGLVDDTVGQLGIMSYIYGLHLINCGAPSRLWTAENIVEKLFSMRLQDGGWAVTGLYSDVDVTAMCLQAIAASGVDLSAYGGVDEAVNLLSNRQLDSGGFMSVGKENCESAAQVAISLWALGIDPASDARFVKNGNSAVDAVLSYRLPSGGFCHLMDEAENETAGIQVLHAMYVLSDRDGGLFDFSDAPQLAQAARHGWKFWARIAIAACAVLACGLSLIRRHGRAKRLLSVALLTAIALFSVQMIHVETASDYYSASAAPSDPAGHVWLTIRCDTVAGRADDGSTPADGTILERTLIGFAEGDSVYDVLTYAVRQYGIQMEHQGSSENMAYINGINYLYEFDYGDLSGWIYSVNGVQESVGCGSCLVHDGDEIAWEYTLNLGEDLK